MRSILVLALMMGYITAYTQNKNFQLLGKLSYGSNSIANLDGYADSLGREFALVGTENGLSIVNITDPVNPVQVKFVNGANSFWREVRHYKKYAYVTNEGGGGLQIVDLSKLPDTIRTKSINPLGMSTSHSIFIDEKGVAYINGADVGTGGVIFLNLEPDPWNPTVLGQFDNNYVHDCYARGDTMWAALINDGIVKVVDVSNKAQTNAINKTWATWSTPSDFSHNCWLDSSGNYLFTTDERENSYLACYDVSNLNNITETDRIQHKSGSNAIVHNTYWMDDFCISSYYTEGVTIHDVSRKHNLVEVGNYDTSPSFSGNQGGGFHGAWGVWPFLPSGNVIASDIEEGLYILKPTYKKACYLEGIVKDSVCGVLLNNVLVEVLNTSVRETTQLTGAYATGWADSGTYDIRFSRSGYATKVVQGVTLLNGVLTNLNIDLVPVSTVQVSIELRDSATWDVVADGHIRLQQIGSADVMFVQTDNTGKYTACDITQGSYVIYYGKWGYLTKRDTINIQPGLGNFIFELTKGYYDDFTFDFNWQVESSSTAGKWVKVVPKATSFQGVFANPNRDVLLDFNQDCYVTGNNGVQAGDDDVDDGSTKLTSPVFDLSTADNPYINYYRWFFNEGGNSTPDDSLVISISNGMDTKIADLRVGADSVLGRWYFYKFRVKDYLPLTANMRLSVYTSDYAATGHLVEAGFDMFYITDTTNVTGIGVDAKDRLVALGLVSKGDEDYVKVTMDATQGGILSFYDITGRVISVAQVKNADCIAVPKVEKQIIFAVLVVENERYSRKIWR